MNNNENNEKLIELLMKLERNEIDKNTYNQEFEKLVNSEEYKNNIRKPSLIDIYTLKKPSCILFIVIIVLLISLKMLLPRLGRPYIYAPDYKNLDEPLQEQYEGTEYLNYDNTKIKVNLIYKYKIKGRVLATFRYLPTSTANKLSPVDVGIAWGYILNDKSFNSIKWYETGNRRLRTLPLTGSKAEIAANMEGLYSNSHLVPNNKKTRKLIKKIRRGDYVQIEGYLANIYWDKGGGNYYWESSTTREDTGDGACEVIYVTDIKWLKPEK